MGGVAGEDLDEEAALRDLDGSTGAVPQPHVQPWKPRLAMDGEEVEVAAHTFTRHSSIYFLYLRISVKYRWTDWTERYMTVTGANSIAFVEVWYVTLVRALWRCPQVALWRNCGPRAARGMVTRWC